MADPAPATPLEWIEDQHHRRVAGELRAAATALRADVTAIAERLRTLPAHDRVDVWQGPAADAARRDRTEAIRRVASPHSGALPEVLDAARRLDARADAHDDATASGPPASSPPAIDVVDLWADRWAVGPPGTD